MLIGILRRLLVLNNSRFWRISIFYQPTNYHDISRLRFKAFFIDQYSLCQVKLRIAKLYFCILQKQSGFFKDNMPDIDFGFSYTLLPFF